MGVPCSVVQLDMMRHALDTLYARGSAYATRLAGMDLDEKERNVLAEQHRKKTVAQAMNDIESVFGRFEPPPRDHAEVQCP